MKSLFVILAILTGCAPKAIIVDPIAPVAEKAHAAAVATGTASRRVEDSAKAVSDQASTVQDQVIRGMLEADRIRKAGLATPEELSENADRWHEANVAVEFMRAATEKHQIDTHELSEAAAMSILQSSELVTTAGIHDAKVQAMQINAARAEADAAFGKSVKWIVWGVLVIAFLFGLAKLMLPLIRTIP